MHQSLMMSVTPIRRNLVLMTMRKQRFEMMSDFSTFQECSNELRRLLQKPRGKNEVRQRGHINIWGIPEGPSGGTKKSGGS